MGVGNSGFLGNSIVTVVGLILGAVGVAFSVFTYLRGRQRKAILFDWVSQTLVEDLASKLDGLEVRFNDAIQERISVTRFAFWSAGYRTIHFGDLTEAAPLGVVVACGADVLDARIIRETEPANQVSLLAPDTRGHKHDETFLRLSFDYLDVGDGAIIQIVHTGEANHEVSMAGRVKGAKAIRRWRSRGRKATQEYMEFLGKFFRPRLMGWLGVLFYLGIVATGVYLPTVGRCHWGVYFLIPFGLLGAWVFGRSYLMVGVPSGIREYL